MRIVEPSVELLSITPDSEKLIERAGRTCYKSEDKITEDSAGRFVEMLRRRDHLSVLEHASATLRFVCDRGVSHEIVRHRTGAYSQESTRYCNYGQEKFGQEIKVIEPPLATKRQRAIWREAMAEAERAYLALLDADVAPQIARSVLPAALATELVMTMNFRNWLHFIAVRSEAAAHPQVRPLAEQAWRILAEQAPAVFAAPPKGS